MLNRYFLVRCGDVKILTQGPAYQDVSLAHVLISQAPSVVIVKTDWVCAGKATGIYSLLNKQRSLLEFFSRTGWHLHSAVFERECVQLTCGEEGKSFILLQCPIGIQKLVTVEGVSFFKVM